MGVGDELAWLDATAIGDLVRSGQVKPIEVVTGAIERIERLDGPLNSTPVRMFDAAIGRAEAVDPHHGPFPGVPFLMKDIGSTQAGDPQYLGNEALRRADRRSPADSGLGARFRNAGLVTLGKTNVPEFGAFCDTQTSCFGVSSNPWDLDRSSSGSSGGAASAVAAGLVPLAHANDGGGSLRMPAAWCGLVGLKPSRGRMPATPGFEAAWYVSEFVLARSVRDCAAALDACHGADSAELYQLPAPARSYVEELGVDPGSLRIGLLAKPPVDIDVRCGGAVNAVGRLLEVLGHRVDVSQPRGLFDPRRFGHMLAEAVFVRLAIDHAFAPFDIEVRSQLGPFAGALFDTADGVTGRAVVESTAWWTAWRRRIYSWWEDDGYDVLVTPTVGTPPLRKDEMAIDPVAPMTTFFTTLAPVMAFAHIFNMSCLPALSLPLAVTDGGLPIGVQFVAKLGREDVLLRLAAQLEVAKPWSARRPSATQ